MINSESCIFRMKLFQMKMFQVRFMLRTGVHSVEMNHDGFSSFLYPLKSEFKFATHDTSIRFNFMFRMKLSQMKKFNWRNSSEIHVTITCYIAVRFRSTLIIFSSTSPLHSNTVLTAKTRSRIIITSRGEFSSWNKHTFALGCDKKATIGCDKPHLCSRMWQTHYWMWQKNTPLLSDVTNTPLL